MADRTTVREVEVSQTQVEGTCAVACTAGPAATNERSVLLATFFVIVALALVALGLLGVDRWFYERISLRLNTPSELDTDFYSLTAPFWFAARLWSHVVGFTAACCFVAAFHPRGLRAAGAAMLTVLTAGGLARVAQLAIGRARPNMSDSHLTFHTPFSVHDGVGFPSGEVATGFALAWVLGHLWPSGKPWFYAAATLCLLARLLPGMHYLSDVSAGALFGAGLACVLFRFYENHVISRLMPPRHP